MRTKDEKTLSMRLSYVMGELWDYVNDLESESESSRPKDPFRHLRSAQAKKARQLVTRLQREVQEINYIEVE